MNRRNYEQLQNIKNLLRRHNLQQLIKGITRPLCTGSSCIDCLITNSKFVLTSGISKDLISDHLPIFAVRKKDRNRHIKTRVLTRTNKKLDKDIFNNMLDNCLWENFLEIKNPDTLWDIMLTNITDILSVMCPLKYRNVFVSKPEWITDDLLALMNQRNCYVKLAKEPGAEVYYKLARFLRNKCNKLVNCVEGDFIRNKLTENKKHPKRFWRQINALISPSTGYQTDQYLIDPETGKDCPPGSESDVINRYYASVGMKILANHQGNEPWDDLENLFLSFFSC